MDPSNNFLKLLKNKQLDPLSLRIAEKVVAGERITDEDAMHLYQEGELSYLSLLADHIRRRKNGLKTYFNRNFHVEPTNVCVYDCSFCSYSRKIKKREDGWELDMDQIMDQIKKYDGQPVTEVHIVGGVMPQYNHQFYIDLFQNIKAHRPGPAR